MPRTKGKKYQEAVEVYNYLKEKNVDESDKEVYIEEEIGDFKVYFSKKIWTANEIFKNRLLEIKYQKIYRDWKKKPTRAWVYLENENGTNKGIKIENWNIQIY